MLVLLSADQSLYRSIKTSLTLTQYPAHAMLDCVRAGALLPFPLSFCKERALMLLPPPIHAHYASAYTSMLGMLYMAVPNSIIVYIANLDGNANFSDASIFFALSVARESFAGTDTTKQPTKKQHRPIFFDILFSLPEEVGELPTYKDDVLHTILSVASRYWESHQLHTLLISPSLFSPTQNTAYTVQDEAKNKSALEAFAQLCSLLGSVPRSTALPQAMQEWISEATETWMLSSSNLSTLRTLIEGYHQQGYEVLPQIITAMLKEPITKPEDRSALFAKAKQVLLNMLH